MQYFTWPFPSNTFHQATFPWVYIHQLPLLVNLQGKPMLLSLSIQVGTVWISLFKKKNKDFLMHVYAFSYEANSILNQLCFNLWRFKCTFNIPTQMSNTLPNSLKNHLTVYLNHNYNWALHLLHFIAIYSLIYWNGKVQIDSFQVSKEGKGTKQFDDLPTLEAWNGSVTVFLSTRKTRLKSMCPRAYCCP